MAQLGFLKNEGLQMDAEILFFLLGRNFNVYLLALVFSGLYLKARICS